MKRLQSMYKFMKNLIILLVLLLAFFACSDDDSKKLGPQFDTLTTNSSYSTDRAWFSGYIYEGYIYITGGYYGGAYLTSIEYATVSDNGTLGTFSSATLPEGRAYHSCIAHKGYLYIVAGRNASDMTNTIYYAPISNNGSLGTFQTATGTLNTARVTFGIAIVNNIMYVMGGNDIGGFGTRSVEYAVISTNGDVGSFTEVAEALISLRSTGGAGTAYNGYLYVAGGRKTGTSSFDTVEYAKIENDGSVGTFTVADETCLQPREIFGITAYNGHLYLPGGNNAASGETDTVEYAPLASDTGAPGAFAYTTEKLPYVLMHHSVQAYRDRLYIIGGSGSTKAIYSAPFLPQ